MKRETLEKKTRADLFIIAKKKKIEKISALRKDELVKVVLKHVAAAEKKKAAKKTAAQKKTTTAKKTTVTKAISARKKTATTKTKRRAKKTVIAEVLMPSTEDLSKDKEKVEETKFFLGARSKPETFSEDTFEFPQTYGENRLSLMARDPWWLYTYWEVTDAVQEETRSLIASRGLTFERSVLRVYDVTGVDFDGENANHYFDITLHGGAMNWYVSVGEANRSWCVDVGMLTQEGAFFCLVRSNCVTTPRFSPSNVLDEEWLSLDEDYWQLFGIAGGFGIGKSSMEMKDLIMQRYQEEISSGSISSLSSPVGAPVASRKFWLLANCELIVYGATEPDAKVTVQGKPLTLRSDGTFTLRYELPNGTTEIPIEATSADGIDTKGVSFDMRRATDSF